MAEQRAQVQVPLSRQVSLEQNQVRVWEWLGSCLFLRCTLRATAGCQTPLAVH